MPIDLVFPITPNAIRTHIAAYDDRARELYAQFLIVDCLYPLTLALFLSLWWTQLLRFAQPQKSIRMVVLLPWLMAILDLSENAGFGALIWRYPLSMPLLELLVTVLRGLKLAVLAIVLLGSLPLLAFWRHSKQSFS